MNMRAKVEARMTFGLISLFMFGRPALAENENEAFPEPEATALVQIWGTAWDQDRDVASDPGSYGDPEDDLGFKIRRARYGLAGLSDNYAYQLSIGFASAYDSLVTYAEEIELVDAVGSARLQENVWVHLGYQKVPVSREFLLGSFELLLGERSAGTEWIAPGRDVGVVVDGHLAGGTLRGRLGVFNGNGAATGDTDPGVLSALRVDMVFGDDDLENPRGVIEGFCLGVGFDGWMDQSFSTRTIGAGVDLALRAGGFSALLEARANQISPVANLEIEAPTVWSETNRIGALAQVGYSVGNFEPAVRFSTFDDNLSATDNGDIGEILAGGTWREASGTVTVGGGYVKRLEFGGADLPNDTVRIWFQTQL